MKLIDVKSQSYLMPILILCLISGIVVVFFRLFSVKDLWYETYAAIIGVIITAVITFILLKGQTENEEEREKSLELHKRKIEVYASFVQELWSKLDDNHLDNKELLQIRRKCFNEVIFYLDERQIEGITEQFKKVSNEIGNGGGETELANILAGPFAEITKVLIEDIDVRRADVDKNIYRYLFNSFNVKPSEETIVECKTKPQEEDKLVEFTAVSDTNYNPQVAEQSEQKKEDYGIDYAFYGLKGEEDLQNHCWNFNVYDWNIQKEHLDKLALIEYGEDWRTSKAKKVKDGDLVFLYARGGGGYRGVFKAKNIVYDGKNDSPTLVFDSTKETDQDYMKKKDASSDL